MTMAEQHPGRGWFYEGSASLRKNSAIGMSLTILSRTRDFSRRFEKVAWSNPHYFVNQLCTDRHREAKVLKEYLFCLKAWLG
jgi:hypothetical protein